MVYDEAALVYRRNLIIADLHLGYELELERKGIAASQLEQMKRRIEKLIDLTRPKRVVILGDLKHLVALPAMPEKGLVLELLSFVKEFCEVVLVRGNHDSGIERICRDLEILPELRLGSTLLAHGHRRLKGLDEKVRTIVIAHVHPLIRAEKAWLIGRYEKRRLVVMPAFSDLVGGVDVSMAGQELIGPIAKRASFDCAYTLKAVEVNIPWTRSRS